MRLSLYGYTTKRDLLGLGLLPVHGPDRPHHRELVNLFLASSSALQFAISVIGVLIVFAGLTAYDTQNDQGHLLRRRQRNGAGRKAIMGALSLYLDFINMFLLLLQLFGDRR